MTQHLLQQAQAAQRAGDLAAAVAHYHAVLRQDAAQPIALNALGMVALRRGEAAAADWFARAAEADPSAGAIWQNLASAHRAAGRRDAERVALERALAIDQRNVMANYRLAELLDAAGEPAAAIVRWQGIVTMLAGSPDRPAALDTVLATASARVAEHGTRLSEAINDALADGRAALGAQAGRRFEACVDTLLGRRRIYTNECHGLHFPFLPADEFFDRAAFSWLSDLEAATPSIRGELEVLMADRDSGFAPYVALDAGSPDNRWTALDGSSAWSARYLWRFGVRDDAVCARCPATAAALAAVPQIELPGQAPTAFFSVLQPGTRLPAHSGVSNVRAIVHLPLIVPARCGLRVGGETRPWQLGEALVFDDTIEHEAWNESDTVRAVLILDAWNPHLTAEERAMLQTLFAALKANDQGGPSIAD